jgi:hypothetical protein
MGEASSSERSIIQRGVMCHRFLWAPEILYRKLHTFENKIMKIYEPEKDEVRDNLGNTREIEEMACLEHRNVCSSQSDRKTRAEHVARLGCLMGTVWFEVLVTKQRVEVVSVELRIILKLLLRIGM